MHFFRRAVVSTLSITATTLWSLLESLEAGLRIDDNG